MTVVPILAVIGYAVTNGSSPILQKIGAEKEKRTSLLDIGIILRLMKNKPYLVGTALQITGLVFGLIALRVLPLFLVQSVLTSSIVITAIAERLITRHHFNHKTVKSIIVVLVGLALLALTAEPSRALQPGDDIRLGIELAPIGLASIGLAFVYFKHSMSAVFLSLMSGIAFGAMALIGRIITYPMPLWQVFANPLLWSLIVYGLIGQFLFIKGLQRASGTSINALSLVAATLVPAVTGILLFNDKIRSGHEIELIIGAVLVFVGSLAISQFDKDLPDNFIL